MRGRVGRSDTSAFTYLLYAPETKLTSDAKRRLKALRELSGLGSGYELANRDLEIRGAGNIFGTDQSGDVGTVGYELYMNLLEEAIVTARGTTIRAVPECKVSSTCSGWRVNCSAYLC
jgi:transcription-repair coupling factor (superfamily II helicase)